MIFFQIALSISLIVLILIQHGGKGMGRGGVNSFSKRGLEKVVFRSTFIISFLFLVVSILALSL